MPAAQQYTFATATFTDVVAHNGQGQIAAARVLAREQPGVAFVDLVVVPPGSSIGDHRHGGDEEIYVIIAGHGTMVVDGQPLVIGIGDVVVNRPGGTHGLANTGAQPLRLVVVDVSVSEAE